MNLTELPPKSVSALLHAHTKQDEFIYVISGSPTLVADERLMQLSPGMCAGFKAGTGKGHKLVNDSDETVVYLEVGDRTADDEVSYPEDDLKAVRVKGALQFVHKDGQAY